MQPNQISNQPTPTPMPNPAPTSKTTKLPWTCATIAIILALAGIGFGIYGIMKPAETHDIENAEVQIQHTDGTIASLRAEKVEKTSDGKTLITITDASPVSSDDISIYSNIEDNGEEKYTQNLTVHFSKDGNEEKKMYVHSSNGKLYCEIEDANEYDPGNYYSESKIEKCDLNAHQGEVVDIVDGLMGNGGEPLVLILNSKGEVEYIESTGENAGVLKKLVLPKKVIQIYGDKKIRNVSFDGEEVIGSGLSVLIKFADGLIEDAYHYFSPQT